MEPVTLQAPVLLDAQHRFDHFSCGEAALDDWLKRRARANQVSGASRCYVVADRGNAVLGYYAISSGALAVADAPGTIRRNMPDPIPMAIIGRLAVDRSQQGKGLGVALLQDAVLRIKLASEIMGIRGIIVHAISESAKRFYEHHGFIPGAREPMTLILSIAEGK